MARKATSNSKKTKAVHAETPETILSRAGELTEANRELGVAFLRHIQRFQPEWWQATSVTYILSALHWEIKNAERLGDRAERLERYKNPPVRPA